MKHTKQTTDARPSAYGYVRVSSDSQARSGLGLTDQTATIKSYCRQHKLVLVTVYCDKAVSASRYPLSQRPQGGRLLAEARRGDHIVIAKLDRAFRNLRDFATEFDRWQSRGVIVHLLDLHVDTGTHVGKFIAGVMAAVAEWEANRIGDRIKAGHDVLRSLGYSATNTPLIGYRLGRRSQRGKARKLVADDNERRAMKLVVKLRGQGKAFRVIAEALRRQKLRTRDGKAWNQQRVWRLYYAEMARRGKDRIAPPSFRRRSEAYQLADDSRGAKSC